MPALHPEVEVTPLAKIIAAHWPGEMSGTTGGWGRTPVVRRSPLIFKLPGRRGEIAMHDFVDCSCGRKLRATKELTVDQVWAEHVARSIG